MYLLHITSNNKHKIYSFSSLLELLKFIKNGGLSVDGEISFIEESLFH